MGRGLRSTAPEVDVRNVNGAAASSIVSSILMSSRLEVVDHHLKLRTHLLASSGSVIAVADADAVSVFTIADFEVTLRGRVDVEGAVISIALSSTTSSLHNLAIFDESNCLRLYRIRLRSVENAPMIANDNGSFYFDSAPTCLLMTPEICLVCVNLSFVIINGSIHTLDVPAYTAAITTSYYAIASLDQVVLFQGKRIQWTRSCSCVSSLLFASHSLVAGHHNGTISVYSIAGNLLSRILTCDSILRLLGPVKFGLRPPAVNETLKSLPLELFNHKAFPSDHVIIVQTKAGIILWPYCNRNDGEIQCPTVRDLLTCDSSYDFNEGVLNLCLISSDASFTLLVASEHNVIARCFIAKASDNIAEIVADPGEMSRSVASKEPDQEESENNITMTNELRIMDFLPEHPQYEKHPFSPSKNSTVFQEILSLKEEFRQANLEILELRSSLSAFSDAMAKSMTQTAELLESSQK